MSAVPSFVHLEPLGAPASTRATSDGPDALGVRDWLEAWREPTLAQARLLALRTEVVRAAEAASGRAVWIHLCPEAAWTTQIEGVRRRLAEAGGPLQAIARYPLLGVPFAVKDNIDIAGEPTTAACPAFAHTAAEHATVVQRLLDAGALWLGKTNLDQFATGLVGTRSPHGQPASVADATRVSGGSSSGSAVAVARGWVAFALGTDTAGSGRIPAGFNGLVGLKPTPGRVPTTGVLPACRTLDCVSVFAHTVTDASRVLAVIEGEDARDAYSAHVAGPAAAPARVRVGVPEAPVFRGEAGYEPAWRRAVEQARGLGWEVVPLDFSPLFEVAALLYEGPWVAERHAVLQALLDTRPQAVDETVRRVVSRAVGMSATDAFRAQYRLRELQARLRRTWEAVDALLVPTAPGHPTFSAVAADPVGENAALGTYTNFVNLLGWCALALPAGTTACGLPFGITLIGPGAGDVALSDLGRRWEQSPRGADASAHPAATPLNVVGLEPAAAGPVPATEPCLSLAVVGAHLSGLPLNAQLIERGARLLRATRTAPRYRLHALPGTTPPKPGLVRVRDDEPGASIEVEVWSMPQARVGSFLALIPPPLGLGSIELEDGTRVHGFLCEAHALQAAPDISHLGGWRAFLASRAAS
ncbi:MAG: allophanate hydrolase [Rubrivivax sp.]